MYWQHVIGMVCVLAACHRYGVCTVGCVACGLFIVLCFSVFLKPLNFHCFRCLFSDVLINNMHSELGATRNG